MRRRAKEDGPLSGAKGGEIAEGYDLAVEAWGEAATAEGSGLLAFAYLWRRFGPPNSGSDPHKDLCSYVLATPMKGVFLWLGLSGSPLAYACGYLVSERVRHACEATNRKWIRETSAWMKARGFTDWWGFWLGEEHQEQRKALLAEVGPRPDPREGWRDDPGPVGRANRALLGAMAELLRPVFVRDVPVNLFGVCHDFDVKPAEASKYAGHGVPVEAMDALLSDPA